MVLHGSYCGACGVVSGVARHVNAASAHRSLACSVRGLAPSSTFAFFASQGRWLTSKMRSARCRSGHAERSHGRSSMAFWMRIHRMLPHTRLEREAPRNPAFAQLQAAAGARRGGDSAGRRQCKGLTASVGLGSPPGRG